VLAADRDNPLVRDYYQAFHPSVFDLLARMVADAEREEKELVLFGEGACDPLRLPFYVGAGVRTFSIAPVRAKTVRGLLARWTLPECEELAERVLDATSSLDVQRILLEAER
jgi:phosphotransferase system enzyme I (PtsI)